MNRMNVLIIALMQLFVYFSLLGQDIQNGGFESGSTATFISQIYKADFWGFGCDGTASLYDCHSPQPETFPGPSPVATPILCVNPRNNGLNNCRFGAINSRKTFQSSPGIVDTSAGESIINELNGNLLPNIEYKIHAYVARGNYYPVVQPVVRKIEVVLRTGNCIDEIIIPIPIDITYNSCEWMSVSTSFQISSSQASLGYNYIEFRDASTDLNSHGEMIFIDDVWLENLGRDVSVNNNDKFSITKGVNIYPNPVINVLNIETDLPFERAVIMDLTGKELLEQVDSKTVMVDNLSSGIYIVYLEDIGRKIMSIQKFTKQ